jgi:O-acetyl-ADP-ribose deacetylase (regulator of RNase III)
MKSLSVFRGDITSLKLDAIVNAANSSLLGGGGVDGAIHRAAGPKLLEECRSLNGCAVGEAKVTHGYELPATWVIHTVGPVWYGGTRNEESFLRSCYRSCFDLVVENNITSVAFPAISTGAYRYPLDLAATVAVSEAQEFLKRNDPGDKIILFVGFTPASIEAYQNAAREIFGCELALMGVLD